VVDAADDHRRSETSRLVVSLSVPKHRRAIGVSMLDAFDGHGVDARVYQTRIGRGATVFQDGE